MTRKTAKEYARIKVKGLKEEAIYDTFLNVELDLSRRKVQKDIMSVDLKRFNRIAFKTGSIFALPTDLMEVPDAIIDVKASTGTRAAVTTAFSGANNDMTLTWLEPGTGGNLTDVIAMNDGQSSGILITYSFNTTGIPFFLVSFAPGATASSIITAINADPVMNQYVSAENASGNTGAGTITLGVSMVFTTSGGTGSGWVTADETSMDNLSRMAGITLLAPSANFPKFAQKGSTDGTAVLEFMPKSVTYAMINYKYWLADLSADTDELGIYKGGEELVLLDLISKCYGLLKEQAMVETAKVEFENAKNKYLKGYQDQLAAMVQEKERMQTADKAN